MEKNTLLQEVKLFIQKGLITKKELIDIYNEAMQDYKGKQSVVQSRLSAILYFIGGAVVFFGIAIYFGQNWNHLNSVTKIGVTLGSSVAAYIVGLLFNRYEKLDIVSQSFYFISCLLAPVGVQTVFDVAGFDVGSLGLEAIVSGIVLCVFLSAFLLYRKIVFLVFSVAAGTWLFLSFAGLLIQGHVYLDTWRVDFYLIVTVGFTYMLLGYSFETTEDVAMKTLSRWVSGIGVFVFLTSGLILGGWKPNQNVFWELGYPGLVFGIIFLSVYLKNKSYLFFGAIYLMFYILKITNEYFTSGIGWPLSLIFAGFALMGIGYFAFYLNKKYLAIS